MRDPKRRALVVADDARLQLEGPVLLTHAGNPLEELRLAVVYPLASMRPVSSPPVPLDDELGRFEIGRTTENAVVVDDLAVSKRHACIVRHSRRWALMDQ